VISAETRMMGLPYGEEIVIVGRTMWTHSTSVTDGRTDGRTDRITIANTVQRIASHGKKCINAISQLRGNNNCHKRSLVELSKYQRMSEWLRHLENVVGLQCNGRHRGLSGSIGYKL